MMNCFLRAKSWQPFDKFLGAWNYLHPELPKIKLVDPMKVGAYEEFHRADLPPPLKEPASFICNGMRIEGFLSKHDPFQNLARIVDCGRRFKDVNTYVFYTLSISYQEKGIKQNPIYRNNVEIRFQDSESKFSVYFGERSKYRQNEELFQLIKDIEEKRCFKFGDVSKEKTGFGIDRLWDSSLPSQAIVKGLKSIMELVGYDFIAEVKWTLGCSTFDESEKYGIQCYNQAVELKIPAENYYLELLCRFKNFEGIEELRPLCGPDDCLGHQLGLLPLLLC